MRYLAIVVILAYFLVPGSGYCDELNSEKKAAIKELMEVTGALKLGEIFSKAFIKQMTQALKRSKPDIDPKAFDILEEEVKALIHEELVVNGSLYPFMYPIYHKYLTLEETYGLIKFYKTPLGEKAISVMPKMTIEGMKAGQLWGQSIGKKIQQRLSDRFKKEGLEI